MSTIPTVTEQNIRTFVGEQNFLKGQQAVRDGAIVNSEQQAMTLKAYCYGSLHDEDGALGRVVQECVEGLGACLESEREDETLRKQILEAIFAVYRFDVDHGGFGLTKDIPPEFFQGTTLEEKHLVAQWVRAVLAELQEKKPESDWRRKRFGGLLLALEADLLSDEEFLRIGRETKSIQEVVTRLLELDRVDEAVQDASQASGWQLVKLADLFVQYGQDAAVERMMYEKAQQEMYTITAEWLKNHYLAKNNLAAALEMAQLIFQKRPWFAEYQKMREISKELGNWEAVRQEALMFLEATKNISTLIEAALDEGDIERALQLLQATKPFAPESYQWQYDYTRTPDVALKAGKGVTLPGFGGFYVRPEPESWVFKFNPGQRLRVLFGWSSTYSEKL